MMDPLANLGFAKLPGGQTAELPYAGGQLSMMVLLPDTSEFVAFIEGGNRPPRATKKRFSGTGAPY